MLDVDLLFPTGGMRPFATSTYTSLNIFHSSNTLHSFIAFTSLSWLYCEHLRYPEAFHGVSSAEGY